MWPRTLWSEEAGHSQFPYMFRNLYISVIPLGRQRVWIAACLSLMKGKLEGRKNCYGTAIKTDGRFEAPTLYGPNCAVS